MNFTKLIFATFMVILFAASATELEYPPGTSPLFNHVSDPLEGYNRSIECFNKNAELHLAYPLGTAYNALMPGVVRTSLYHFKRNLLYPLRFINCALQGKGNSCWTETERFFVNTTVGVAGIMDPASKWHIPIAEEDFEQTLGHYGMKDGCYINLPFLGPSSAKNVLGLLLDTPCDPLFWITNDTVRYSANGTLTFNSVSSNTNTLNEFFTTTYQTYPMTQAFYFQRYQMLTKDVPLPHCPNPDTDQAFNFINFVPKLSSTISLRKERFAQFPNSKYKMPYACWPHKNPKGVLLILPGIGGHHMDSSVAALAEVFYQHGWSCVAISSTFTPAYSLNIPQLTLPGFFPRDTTILTTVLKTVVADFTKRYPYAVNKDPVSIIGFSLGAINGLYLAAEEQTHKETALPVKNYVIINPPRNILHALKVIDQFFAIPEKWPADKREQIAANLYQKLGAILQKQALLVQNNTPLPLTREESQFLIGLNMHLQLTQLICATHKRNPMGILKTTPTKPSPNEIWRQALFITFSDYMNKVMFPPEKLKEMSMTLAQVQQRCSLDSLTPYLENNPKVHLFQNKNDFLLSKEDIIWFKSVFKERAHIFLHGSHLGNMMLSEYQKKLLEALTKKEE